MAAQRRLIVLDPDRGGLGGAEGVDAEQVRQCAVVHGEGLGDLQEPDELEPVQTLGAGRVGMDLREPGVDGGVSGDQAVDVGEPKDPGTPCIIVFTEETLSPPSPRWRMYSSTCARWIPTSGSSPLV